MYGVVKEQAKLNQMSSVSVKIPRGVDDGTRIRISGKGEAGNRGTKWRFIFVHIRRAT